MMVLKRVSLHFIAELVHSTNTLIEQSFKRSIKAVDVVCNCCFVILQHVGIANTEMLAVYQIKQVSYKITV